LHENNRRKDMAFLAWIVLGLLAGFIAGKVENKREEGIALNLPLGIVGAVVGGLIFNGSGAPGVHGLNLYSLFVALVGSVLVLAIYHVMFRRV
jgi:uncharacterized membrane protein YeaQ/YmgE (transglycosylase-associated protein family)